MKFLFLFALVATVLAAPAAEMQEVEYADSVQKAVEEANEGLEVASPASSAVVGSSPVGRASLAEITAASKGSGAVEYDDSNYEQAFVQDHFVMFYMPTCPHCIAAQPKLDEVAEKLASEGVTVAKIDGVANSKAAVRFGISRVPTHLFFKDNKYWEYNGDKMDVDAM
jgi:thiol-disulfide isomerase/thioredoxin